jgi:hypothetical protein
MCTFDFAAIQLTPSRLKPVPQGLRSQPDRTHARTHAFPWSTPADSTGFTRSTSGTGFSREEARMCTLDFAAIHLTPSRLKPVPQGSAASRTERTRFHGKPHSQSHWMHAIQEWDRLQPGRGPHVHPGFCSDTPDAFPAKAGPTMDFAGRSTECSAGPSVSSAASQPDRTHAFPWSAPRPIPLDARDPPVGPASAGKRPACAPWILQRYA